VGPGETITSRERVRRALRFEPTDRVPRDLGGRLAARVQRPETFDTDPDGTVWWRQWQIRMLQSSSVVTCRAGSADKVVAMFAAAGGDA
jgi:hypothetical protein